MKKKNVGVLSVQIPRTIVDAVSWPCRKGLPRLSGPLLMGECLGAVLEMMSGSPPLRGRCIRTGLTPASPFSQGSGGTYSEESPLSRPLATWTAWKGETLNAHLDPEDGVGGVTFRELPGSALSLKPLCPEGRWLSKSHFCPQSQTRSLTSPRRITK